MGLIHALFVCFLFDYSFFKFVYLFQGGFLYYMFSNLTVFTALLSNSVHLACEGRKGVLEMVKHIGKSAETFILVIVHLLLFGYGIFAM
jgi:hypothetical protein